MDDLMTRQAELEYESVVMGERNYRKAQERSESETPVGQDQIDQGIDALALEIDAFVRDAAEKDRAGHMHTTAPFIATVEPEQAAYLTIRYALDGVAAGQNMNTVALALGNAIEDHLDLVGLNQEAPGLYRKVMEQVRQSTSARHREGVLHHVIEKYGTTRRTWTNAEKLKMGYILVRLYAETCGVVEECRQTEGHHDTPMYLRLTERAASVLGEAHAAFARMQPVHQPMIVAPRDWHTRAVTLKDGTAGIAIRGGYLTGAIRRARMVQSRLPGGAARLARRNLENVFGAVNAIQRTPWRINRGLLDVAEQCRAGGVGLLALLTETKQELPPRPAELMGVAQSVKKEDMTVAQREALIVWKQKRAKVHEFNARVESKTIATLQQLVTARKFMDEAAIYFPHYLDFRGRIYPFAAYLNPQSSDVGRALLEFAEGKPLGERGLFWLKVHVANLFGIDKVSFEERVRWVNENLDKLLDSASQPLDGAMFWTQADSPWCALAGCVELAGALVAGPDYVSHLPIAMDGSCSGLQHYSAMLRDPIGGAAVNLVPAAKPGDIYTQVAKRAQDLSDSSSNGIKDAWAGKVTRKVAKQPTMTMCYSATVYGMQRQIEKAVEGLGGRQYLDAELRPACIYMAQTIWDAIGDVVVAARRAMDFLQECSAVMSETELAVCWTAPSGFLVEQGYRKVKGVRVPVHYKGTRVRLTLAEDTEVLDPKKQSAGIAPNFVHSLDSSHLMATVNLGTGNGLKHWACIHDSFGVHAGDVDVLHQCIRESFIEQYAPNVLENFRAEVVEQLSEHPELIAKLPAVPPQGTLDLAAVREAKYLFA